MGVGPHPADRALHVGELGRVVVALAPEAVVQDVGGDSLPVEPLRGLVALVVLGEASVTAAGQITTAAPVWPSLPLVG